MNQKAKRLHDGKIENSSWYKDHPENREILKKLRAEKEAKRKERGIVVDPSNIHHDEDSQWFDDQQRKVAIKAGEYISQKLSEKINITKLDEPKETDFSIWWDDNQLSDAEKVIAKKEEMDKIETWHIAQIEISWRIYDTTPIDDIVILIQDLMDQYINDVVTWAAERNVICYKVLAEQKLPVWTARYLLGIESKCHLKAI